jgi:cephalosporin hydroxylase
MALVDPLRVTIPPEASLLGTRAQAQRVVKAVRAGTRIRSFDAAYDFAESFDAEGIAICPLQDREEMRWLWAILEADPPRVVLEIGTKFGGSLFLLARVSAPDALLVGIDLPTAYDSSLEQVYRAFAGRRQRILLVRRDSHDPAAVRRARRALDGRPIDLLHIDGDHSLEGVGLDFEMYAPLVRRGGLVALHDIAGREGVPEFWRRLREERPETTTEILSPGSTIGFGLVRM